jgi:hypothetical protein
MQQRVYNFNPRFSWRKKSLFMAIIAFMPLAYMPVCYPVQAAKVTQISQKQFIPNSSPSFDLQPPALSELPGHGSFIMSMGTDLQNRTWVGTEEQGIWCYDPALPEAHRWKHYTVADGLGDDNGYALCCDNAGRVWVGHSRSGLSVFNGHEWKHYDQITGPLGAHIYAMAVSPKNGDVWTATEAGLCRYSENKDEWSYYVAPQGMLLTSVSGIAFDKIGNIVVGTQTEGIVIGNISSNFERWTQIPGPQSRHPLSTPAGNGLPTRQINCMLTDKSGVIWAGTHDGLAKSSDGGITWSYIRGADYVAKISGMYANRETPASLCGFELMLRDSNGMSINHGRYIAVAAADAPKDQLGVHIECSGGDVHNTQLPINLQKADHPGPLYLYQSDRQGEFTYTLTGLAPHLKFVLRLHFAELNCNGPDQRKFSVLINGVVALQGLDIFELTGKEHVALVQSIPVESDASGKLIIKFTGKHYGPALLPIDNVAVPGNQLMTEDYVTCLGEGASGKIYIGHWTKGVEVYDPLTGVFSPVPSDGQENLHHRTDFAMCILPASGSSVLVGSYGDGLEIEGPIAKDEIQPQLAKIQPVEIAFPTPAEQPTLDEITAIDATLQTIPLRDMKPGNGVYYSTDWVTRGDWVGKYGSRLALLCAADAPLNYNITNDWDYACDGAIGPNIVPGDDLRRWIQWLRTDDPRVLYNPVIGARRESEWDDHGETYPVTTEGPDVWVTVSVPSGIHRLTGYFVNKDGHDGSNRFRDYLVDLLPWRADVRDAIALKPISSVRIREFWGGEYQSFAVCGPAKFYLHIARNNSFNTIISSIMIDKIDKAPSEFETRNPGLRSLFLSTPKYAEYVTPPVSVSDASYAPPETDAIRKLWSDLDAASGKRQFTSLIVTDRLLCYRALASAAHLGRGVLDPKAKDLLAWWRRSLPMETEEDRLTFTGSMADMYADEVKLVQMLNTKNL